MTALLIAALVALAGLTFLNGFHDASNAVSSAVRTRALSPGLALILVAVFTAGGALLASGLGTALVETFTGTVPLGATGLVLLLTGLTTAGLWGLFTWWRGQPSSSTHATLSGIAGAGLAARLVGLDPTSDALTMLLRQVFLPLLVTSVAAWALSWLLVIPVVWAVRNATARTATEYGRSAQSIGTAAVALAHGLQDGNRSVALAVVAFAAAGTAVSTSDAWWVRVAVAVLLGMGVLGGGWRITHTLSTRLVTLDPLRAGTANVVSASLLFVGAYLLRLPISSTQAVTASLVGAGSNQRHATVNWATAQRIVGYWVLTPFACALGAGVLFLAASPLLR